MPPNPTDYQTRAEYEAAVREYRRAMFPQTLPDKTPEQMKIDRMYPEGTPYDDDAPAPEPKPAPMRMVKNNLTGSQMKIARQADPKDEITGADFKKLREMLMGRGKANAKVHQNGTGDMEAAVAEVKKQNPDATTEEITNFLLNPEAGFQEGDIGMLTKGEKRPGQLPTFEDFFRGEYGYFPTVSETPKMQSGQFRSSDLVGQPTDVYYTDLGDVATDEGLFAGEVDLGAGNYPTAAGRYRTIEDLRGFQPPEGTGYRGTRYHRSAKKDDALRGAFAVQSHVDEASKRYAEMMRKARVTQPRTTTYEAIDPEREGESGGFRVTGPSSQVNKTMGEKLMRAGMYIR